MGHLEEARSKKRYVLIPSECRRRKQLEWRQHDRETRGDRASDVRPQQQGVPMGEVAQGYDSVAMRSEESPQTTSTPRRHMLESLNDDNSVVAKLLKQHDMYDTFKQFATENTEGPSVGIKIPTITPEMMPKIMAALKDETTETAKLLQQEGLYDIYKTFLEDKQDRVQEIIANGGIVEPKALIQEAVFYALKNPLKTAKVAWKLKDKDLLKKFDKTLLTDFNTLMTKHQQEEEEKDKAADAEAAEAAGDKKDDVDADGEPPTATGEQKQPEGVDESVDKPANEGAVTPSSEEVKLQSQSDTMNLENDPKPPSVPQEASQEPIQRANTQTQAQTQAVGGGSKRKILLLSRWRVVRKIGRYEYVKLKGLLVRLSQAKLIEKKVLAKGANPPTTKNKKTR